MRPVKFLPRSVTAMLLIAMIAVLSAAGTTPALAQGRRPEFFECERDVAQPSRVQRRVPSVRWRVVELLGHAFGRGLDGRRRRYRP